MECNCIKGSYKRNDENTQGQHSGIYCILNKINGKRYIGQSYDLKYRWNRHKWDLSGNRHANNHLQSAWNKYGIDAFEYIVIEMCSLDVINEAEIYWIDKYDSLKCGYNQAEGGLGCRGYKHTKEEISKMRKIQNPKSVLQFDLDGNYIGRWESAAQAAKTLNLFPLAIKSCCERKSNVKSIGGYIWIYEEEKNTIDMGHYLNKNIQEPKLVGQFDLNMNLIKIWASAYKASKESEFDAASISQVCNHKRKTYKNYIFAFVDKDGDILDKDNYDYKIDYSYSKDKSKRKVSKFSLSNEYIVTYESISCASKSNNINIRGIRSCCNNQQKSAGGYVWKYVM